MKSPLDFYSWHIKNKTKNTRKKRKNGNYNRNNYKNIDFVCDREYFKIMLFLTHEQLRVQLILNLSEYTAVVCSDN